MQGSWVISKITGNYNNTEQRRKQHAELRQPQHSTSAIAAVPRRPADQRQHAHRQGARDLPGAVGHSGCRARSTTHRANVHPDVRPHQRALGQGRSDAVHRAARQPALRRPAPLRLQVREAVPAGRRAASRPDVRRVQRLQQRRHHEPRPRDRDRAYFTPQGLVLPRRFRLGAVYRF